MTTFVLSLLVYSLAVFMACYAVAGAIITYRDFKRSQISDLEQFEADNDYFNGER